MQYIFIRIYYSIRYGYVREWLPGADSKNIISKSKMDQSDVEGHRRLTGRDLMHQLNPKLSPTGGLPNISAREFKIPANLSITCIVSSPARRVTECDKMVADAANRLTSRPPVKNFLIQLVNTLFKHRALRAHSH